MYKILCRVEEVLVDVTYVYAVSNYVVLAGKFSNIRGMLYQIRLEWVPGLVLYVHVLGNNSCDQCHPIPLRILNVDSMLCI